MTDISIELVPRSYQHLDDECQQLKQVFTFLDTVNIPDLLRMPVRSWEACRHTSQYFRRNIPHLRAIDFNLREPEALEQAIAGLDDVLVVSGDLPQGFGRGVYPTRCLDVIRYIKTHHPAKTVIAGIDPYRQSMREEMEYTRQKVDVGADVFFTQPFFSLHLLQCWFELLPDYDVYWGISPVVGEKAKNYWEYTNHVIFPPEYDFTLEGNQRFARSVVSFVREQDSNLYFMPIKVNIMDYLQGIL